MKKPLATTAITLTAALALSACSPANDADKERPSDLDKEGRRVADALFAAKNEGDVEAIKQLTCWISQEEAERLAENDEGHQFAVAQAGKVFAPSDDDAYTLDSGDDNLLQVLIVDVRHEDKNYWQAPLLMVYRQNADQTLCIEDFEGYL